MGLRITSRQRRCRSLARDTSHRNSVASHHTRGSSLTVTLGLDREASRHPRRSPTMTLGLDREASRHPRRSPTVTLGLDREGSVASPTRHYTRSVCGTPFLFRCNAPHQV